MLHRLLRLPRKNDGENDERGEGVTPSYKNEEQRLLLRELDHLDRAIVACREAEYVRREGPPT